MAASRISTSKDSRKAKADDVRALCEKHGVAISGARLLREFALGRRARKPSVPSSIFAK